MTSAFDRLQDEPQTGVNLGAFSLSERQLVQRIKITSTAGETTANGGGRFTPVYYLAGDERAAAEVFVTANHELLEGIEFSKRNVIEASVSRELYDWILHYSGERTLTVYETVVREDRPDDTSWLIDREKYETVPNRRYAQSYTGSAYVPPDVEPDAVYEAAPDSITEAALADTPLEGDLRQVLDYYRVCDDYACLPTTVDGELAVAKIATADADAQPIEE